MNHFGPALQPRTITAVLPVNSGDAAGVSVSEEPGVACTRHGGVQTWLTGLPYSSDSWLSFERLAACWAQDPQRLLRHIDGTFCLLVVDAQGFHLINDKISSLTWHWTRQGSQVIASTSLQSLLHQAQLPLAIDYPALRHHLYTRAHHFDRCVVRGVSKLLKGQRLGRDLSPSFYYELASHIRDGSRPEDYFQALADYLRQTLRGRKTAVLASNGFDSRMNILLLTQCLEQVEICTFRSDVCSEHRELEQFLRGLPRKNWRLRVLDYSMIHSSPRFTPGRLHALSDVFLDCFDDLTENKEHLIFLSALAALTEEGYEALVTGCMGGDVRRVLPIHVVNHRPDKLDAWGTARTRELFGITRAELRQHYLDQAHTCPDRPSQCASEGQTTYTAPLYAHRGLMQVALPIATAQVQEIYRGIDRHSLPGRGGINFFREFVQAQAPWAAPIPFDTGIAFHAPGEKRPWLGRTMDLAFADRCLRDSGCFDPDVLTLLLRSYGRQRPPHQAAQSYLNLWAWYTQVSGQRELFRQSLAHVAHHQAYRRPPGLAASLAKAKLRGQAGLTLAAIRLLGWSDPRHPLRRGGRCIQQAATRKLKWFHEAMARRIRLRSDLVIKESRP